MLLSSSWIRSTLNTTKTDEEIVDLLNQSGIETQLLSQPQQPFTNVVVAKIVNTIPHPDADRLKVCTVTDGHDEAQIVCGAPNARTGITVALAKIGAVLPENFKIKKSKIRGVESNGMMCSAKELGLKDNKSDGIIELSSDLMLGQDVVQALNFDKSVFEFEITPNRSDCLSLQGIVREVVAVTLEDIKLSEFSHRLVLSDKKLVSVKINQEQACPRLCISSLTDVDVNKPTPAFIRQELELSGISSVNIIVDILNFVMLETGQPMHAYDSDKTHEPICIRFSNHGEKVKLLNQQEITLRDGTLVVADTSKILSIAGIMGSLESSVTYDSKNILIESAFFNPKAISGVARSYSLNTESSHRFERGVDYELQKSAMIRALTLIQKYTGAGVGTPQYFDSLEHLPQKKLIILKHENVEKKLGCQINKGIISGILENLNFQITFLEEAWRITPPSYRFDINIEEDLVEEIARMIGYDNIPNSPIILQANPTIQAKKLGDTFSKNLSHQGFQEVINYSFISPKLHSHFCTSEKESLTINNPISENMSTMRSSILPSLLENVRFNLNRGSQACFFYEQSLVFSRKASVKKPRKNALLDENTNENSNLKNIAQIDKIAAIVAEIPQKTWHPSINASFYTLKQNFINMLGKFSEFIYFEQYEEEFPTYAHPKQSAIIKTKDGKKIGIIGALHPSLNEYFDISKNTGVWFFEVSLEELESIKNYTCYKPVSKFPSISRDLALIVDKKLTFQYICNLIIKNTGKYLISVTPFDIFPIKEVEHKHSIAIRLIWQSNSNTLEDATIDNDINKLLKILEQNKIYLRPENISKQDILLWQKQT